VNGSRQSPVDLGAAVSCEPRELRIDYQSSVHRGHDDGSTHKVPVPIGHSISYDGTSYELDSYHFHTPSEHAIAGELAAAEIHFVHVDAAGSTAVLGVFVEEGEQSHGPRHFSETTAIEVCHVDCVEGQHYVASRMDRDVQRTVRRQQPSDPAPRRPHRKAWMTGTPHRGSRPRTRPDDSRDSFVADVPCGCGRASCQVGIVGDEEKGAVVL